MHTMVIEYQFVAQHGGKHGERYMGTHNTGVLGVQGV